MYVYFSYPTTCTKLIEIQNKFGFKNTKICQLSDTRLICHLKSCDVVLNNFKPIVCVLTEEMDTQESKYVVQANGIFFI